MPTYEFSQALGNAIKLARSNFGLTQSELAELAGVDTRTVLNIENCRGNPKMQVVYPLIRALKMDPRDIFYPELNWESPAIQQLLLVISKCDDQEAQTLLPVCEAVLQALRAKDTLAIK